VEENKKEKENIIERQKHRWWKERERRGRKNRQGKKFTFGVRNDVRIEREGGDKKKTQVKEERGRKGWKGSK
jgi:hypothetical protein